MNGLISELSTISGLAAPIWLAAVLVFLRAGGMVALLPALGDMVLPMRVRLAALLALTLVVAPAFLSLNAELLPQSLTVSLLLSEAVVGLILGFSLRLLIIALQIAGTIAAQSISLAQLFSGTAAEPQPSISSLLVLAATALFVAMGGLEHGASLVLRSYQLIPPGSLPEAGLIADWAAGRGQAMIAQGFVFASPFLLAGLLYNLALGAINRSMPALMVMFIGAPALTLGGLILLALSAPLLLQSWQDLLQRNLLSPMLGE